MKQAKVFIVIPTYNEAENITALIETIQSLGKHFCTIIVDDNSPDATADIAERLGRNNGNVLIHRRPCKMGIGSAIRDGMEIALSFSECEHIVTMDADLSHDPQDIPRLLQACPAQYHFSVASALLIKDAGFKVKEVPIKFVNRRRGNSKLSKSAIISSLHFIAMTFWRRQVRALDRKRFLRFCAVGASGVLVNEGILWLLTEGFGLFYLYAAIVSIEASIISNFILNNRWTFSDRRVANGSAFTRFSKYNLTCLIGVGLNLSILWLLTEISGMHYLISNLFGIAVAVIWNYSASVRWVWMRGAKETASVHEHIGS